MQNRTAEKYGHILIIKVLFKRFYMWIALIVLNNIKINPVNCSILFKLWKKKRIHDKQFSKIRLLSLFFLLQYTLEIVIKKI